MSVFDYRLQEHNVCRRVHVLFTCVKWSLPHIVLCFLFCLSSSCVLWTQCCQLFWIHYWFPRWFSLTFIYNKTIDIKITYIRWISGITFIAQTQKIGNPSNVYIFIAQQYLGIPKSVINKPDRYEIARDFIFGKVK